MAVTILETIKSAANAGNTAYIVILQLLCDTAADLPTQYSMTGYELAQGCKAHVIDTNSDYMLDSSGTWHISGGEIWQNVYTKTETDTLLAGKQDTLTTAQYEAVNSGITAAKVQQYDDTVTDEAEDRAALVELVDGGAKNLLKIVATSQSYDDGNVTFTVNADQTVTVNATNNHAQRALILAYLGQEFYGKTVVISGCPAGGDFSTGYYLLIYKASGSTITYDIGDSATLTIPNEVCKIAIGVRANAVVNNLTFKPMICTAADWAISHKFVPNCPSMQEMYQMILALQ